MIIPTSRTNGFIQAVLTTLKVFSNEMICPNYEGLSRTNKKLSRAYEIRNSLNGILSRT